MEKIEIKLLLLDVDGTLTDGKVYIGNEGELFKAFHVKDGCGIHDLLPCQPVDWQRYNKEHNQNLTGIIPVIITARSSAVLLNRCRELNITEVYQNSRDKAEQLKIIADKYDCKFKDGVYQEMAYMGDDIIDLPAMKLCRVAGCPLDASRQVKEEADFIASSKGGEGAVREFIEWLIDTVN